MYLNSQKRSFLRISDFNKSTCIIFLSKLIIKTIGVKNIDMMSNENIRGVFMLKVGYARVSKIDQDLELQIQALQNYGCEKIFTDKMSGSKVQRPGFDAALNYLREGDILVVWKLDRLGRTMKGLIDLVENLDKRKIDICSITDNINTKGSAGRFFFHIMAAFAVMERELNRERTRAGLEVARRAGKKGGRPKIMTQKKIKVAKSLLNEGMTIKDISQILGVSVPTLYRYFPANKD